MEDDLCHPIQLAKYRYSHLSQFASLRLIRQPGGPDRAFRSIVRSGTGQMGRVFCEVIKVISSDWMTCGSSGMSFSVALRWLRLGSFFYFRGWNKLGSVYFERNEFCG